VFDWRNIFVSWYCKFHATELTLKRKKETECEVWMDAWLTT